MSCQNIVELIGREWIVRTLRLCGARENECGEAVSDYEAFRALCHFMPLLCGHRILARVSAILKHCFGITQALSVDTCDAIWHETADRLLQQPLTAEEMIEVFLTEDSPALLSENRVTLSSAFPATPLAHTQTDSFDRWMREIESELSDAAAKGCGRIFFELPRQYMDSRPDVYHVDLTLHKPQRDQSDLNLLHAQLMRVLAQLAQRMDMQLLVRVECRAEDAIALLDRVEREVGLPPLIWTTVGGEMRDALIAWTEKRHENSVVAALSERDYPSESMLTAAVAEWAVDYPVGRLQLLTQ